MTTDIWNEDDEKQQEPITRCCPCTQWCGQIDCEGLGIPEFLKREKQVEW